MIIVTDQDGRKAYDKAVEAIDEICDQGEGMNRGVFDGDELSTKGGATVSIPAHYFRF